MSDPREKEYRDTRRDNPARFLRELRELRNLAGLGQSELAARAHYPIDVIRAAEVGPALPDLPVLSAYVRGCGGPLSEWEERWRSVTGSPASPILMARAAGCSDAADAGARIGAASAAADGHDPDRVMAALGRVAEGMAAAATSSPSLAEAAASMTSDSVLSGGGLSNGSLSHSAVRGGATGASVWDPAPKTGGGSVWDSGSAAARTDLEADAVTPQPVAPQPVAPSPATPRPAASQSATPQPITPRPAASQSATPQPITPRAAASESAARRSAAADAPRSAAADAPRSAAADAPRSADADAPRVPAQSGTSSTPAQQPVSGPWQRKLSRAALAALVAVALLLIATVLVVLS